MLATPLQLATATALIANRGSWVEPRLLKEVVGDEKAADVLPAETHEPLKLDNPADWEYVVEGMAEVMHGARGTARRVGSGAPYRMAGKTGTAQVFSLDEDEEYDAGEIRERLRDHALFVGFAPVDDPEIVVSVIVENGGSGSGTAAPVARALFDAWLLEFSESSDSELVSRATGGTQ